MRTACTLTIVPVCVWGWVGGLGWSTRGREVMWPAPGGRDVLWPDPRGEGGVVTWSQVGRECAVTWSRGEGGDVTFGVAHLSPPPHRWTEWVTHACENITFARFATRAVIIFWYGSMLSVLHYQASSANKLEDGMNVNLWMFYCKNICLFMTMTGHLLTWIQKIGRPAFHRFWLKSIH